MITLIAAATENNVIGKNNAMPWHMPSDLKLFKRLTLGKPLILGHKNFNAIGRPLPGRLNIVLSRTVQNIAGCVSTTSFENALMLAHAECLRRSEQDIMVIGGAEIYALAMPYASRILLSRLHGTVEGDTFFPAIGPEWHIAHQTPYVKGENDDFSFTLMDYRKSPR